MKIINSLLLSVSLFLFLGSTASAKEIEKGTYQIQGDFDLSISSLEIKPQGEATTDNDTMTIDITALKYMAPNIGVGITWNYELDQASSAGSSVEVETYIIGPAIQIHNEVNDKLNFTGFGAFVLASVEVQTDGFTDASGDGFGWLVGGGIAYFITDSVSLNADIQYTSISIEEDTTNLDLDTSGFRTGAGISVYIK